MSATTLPSTRPVLDPRFRVGRVLSEDDFNAGLSNWSAELENGGTVRATRGALEIEVPAGCTVWFKPRLDGPVLIEYEATMVAAGGANDRVSDLNCFWMARDARSPKHLFGTARSGTFHDYNRLLAYYVGLGGNANTTTRFRRYIGDAEIRPLLPQNDLGDPADLLKPNVPQLIQLVACGRLIQFYRDEHKLFEMDDPHPYTSGWFGLRTVKNHMIVRHFRIYRLEPSRPGPMPTTTRGPE